MAVVLRKLSLPNAKQAAAWKIVAMGTDNRSDIHKFLAELKKKSPNSFKRITSILKQAAEAGPQFHNEEICKRFKGIAGGMEFRCSVKGGHAVRILAFQEKNRLVICTHGFSKKTNSTPPKQINKLVRERNKYMAAKSKAQIRYEE